mmetsp:Transcript_24168/g.61949  ORF Transcript_24168/g.61949 Transcript_24168/m.61949 type:complete len:233 (+) Transcript_24168:599-1297(+)
MLEGLRSRCRMPLAWQAATPRRICCRMHLTAASSIAWVTFISSSARSVLQYSSTSVSELPCGYTSWSCTTLGCSRHCSAFISRRTLSGRPFLGCRITTRFNATTSPVSMFCARLTSPKAPLPILPRTRYLEAGCSRTTGGRHAGSPASSPSSTLTVPAGSCSMLQDVGNVQRARPSYRGMSADLASDAPAARRSAPPCSPRPGSTRTREAAVGLRRPETHVKSSARTSVKPA